MSEEEGVSRPVEREGCGDQTEAREACRRTWPYRAIASWPTGVALAVADGSGSSCASRSAAAAAIGSWPVLSRWAVSRAAVRSGRWRSTS